MSCKGHFLYKKGAVVTSDPSRKDIMADENQDPSKSGQSEETTQNDPDSGQESGQSESKATEPSNIPENLAGKSVEDIVKMYGELERKLGEQSATVAEAKKLKKNQQLLADAIMSDPKLAQQVEGALRKKMGIESDDSGGDEDDKKTDKSSEDLRRYSENKIISEFSDEFGLTELKSEEREKALKEVGQQLADLVDPTGKKSMSEVLSSVSLEKLPDLLRKSYFLTNMENIMSGDKSSLSNLSALGRISSAGGSSDQESGGLTPEEKEVAKKLGVSEEKYLKRKKESNK